MRATLQASTTFGESVRRIDTACPGSHTQRMYDSLSKKQTSVLAQLCTEMTPLKEYLHIIRATETSLCDCGETAESRQHFIFHCARWNEQGKILGAWTGENNLFHVSLEASQPRMPMTGNRTWTRCEL